MKLSAPIYQLKRQAKRLSREHGIQFNQALNRIAIGEGFESWSLLAAHLAKQMPSKTLLQKLSPGDLVLIGARPGHGKTMLGLELVAEAVKHGRNGAFFSFEFTDTQLEDRFRSLDCDPGKFADQLCLDTTDDISADHIIERLKTTPPQTIAVVDYLQVLDQRRDTPALMNQVQALKSFAVSQGVIIVCIAQIDRSYEPSKQPVPGIHDVRLPNPIELELFDKTCFLNDGVLQVNAA